MRECTVGRRAQVRRIFRRRIVLARYEVFAILLAHPPSLELVDRRPEHGSPFRLASHRIASQPGSVVGPSPSVEGACAMCFFERTLSDAKLEPKRGIASLPANVLP